MEAVLSATMLHQARRSRVTIPFIFLCAETKNAILKMAFFMQEKA